MIFMANACTAFAINIDDSRAEKREQEKQIKERRVIHFVRYFSVFCFQAICCIL